jgi:hypothetical protein
MNTLVLNNATSLMEQAARLFPTALLLLKERELRRWPSPPGKIRRVPRRSIVTIDLVTRAYRCSCSCGSCRGESHGPAETKLHLHVGDLLRQDHQRGFGVRFTTVRDAAGADPGFREAIRQGLIQGPRLFVAGYALSQTGGHGDFRLPFEMHVLQKTSQASRQGSVMELIRCVSWLEQLRSGWIISRDGGGWGHVSE